MPHDADTISPQPSNIPVARRIVMDKRISNGAVRLFFYLQSRQNPNGQTWPKQLDIARDIGCKKGAVIDRTAELTEAGYIAVEKFGQSHNCKYTILNGDEESFQNLPEWTLKAARTRSSQKRTSTNHPSKFPKTNSVTNGEVPKSGGEVPENEPPRSSQKRTLSRYKGSSIQSSGGKLPPADWQLRKDEREICQRIKVENQKPNPDQGIIETLKQSLVETRRQMGAKNPDATIIDFDAKPEDDDDLGF